MNRKTAFYLLGVLCIIAAVAMYLIGKQSTHLTELADYYWLPLPLALIFLFAAAKTKKP